MPSSSPTYGNNIEEALYMAQEACGMYLFNAIKDGENLPNPSTIKSIKKEEENAFVNFIYVDLNEFAKMYGDRSVKKTLSIPAWLNKACEERHINYSKVLQEALIEILQGQ